MKPPAKRVRASSKAEVTLQFGSTNSRLNSGLVHFCSIVCISQLHWSLFPSYNLIRFSLVDDSIKTPCTCGANEGLSWVADKYDLATHTVKVRRTGTLSDVMSLWDLPGKTYTTPYTTFTLSCVSSMYIFAGGTKKCIYPTGTAVSGSAGPHLEGDKSRFQRMASVDSFNQVCLPCLVVLREVVLCQVV